MKFTSQAASPLTSAVCAGVLLTLSACSSGGDSQAEIQSAVQDLGLDPSGKTTLVKLTEAGPQAGLSASHFAASAGQHALAVAPQSGGVAVLWDAIVNPSHTVRVVGAPDVDNSPMAVTTTNASAPTFTLPAASQVTGLGNDTISVQFSGAHVLEAEVEDASHWQLRVNNVVLDLTGSSLVLDENTQVLSIATGPLANLHASFTLSATSVHSVAGTALASTPVGGTASGDTTAPTLFLAEQNLSEDDAGRVIDFTFSEAMDPVFAVALGNFAPGLPDFAVASEQVAPETLRVTFNNPIVPGINTVLLQNVVDAHGNALPTQATAITAGSLVANDFATTPQLVTAPNAGGDVLTATFLQAIDPDDAKDHTRWALESPLGTPVDLSGATFTYSLATKTLTIGLAQDLVTGDDFGFGPNPTSFPHDVDGEDFTSSVSDSIGGDATGPVVLTVVQNRNLDSEGRTVDVVFTEDLDQVSAEALGNWNVAGLGTVSATLLPSLDTVRVVFDDFALPGTDTLDVTGVSDLAQNVMTDALGLPIATTDASAPALASVAADAPEGPDNDFVRVVFDDDMVLDQVEDPAAWSFESPLGTPLDVSGASVVYEAESRTATLTLNSATGIDLKGDATFKVALAGVQDIAGNAISVQASSGTVVGETHVPTVESIWVETASANSVHVRMSEPCDSFDDLAGWTSYLVRDGSGVAKGTPTGVAIDLDRLGATLTFGFAVLAGIDTLDVHGVTDLSGNSMAPLLLHDVDAEDGADVDFNAGATTVTTVSGEENDLVTVVFDRRPSSWGLLDLAHWSLDDGVLPVDLTNAELAYDGDKTVTIRFNGVDDVDLTTGTVYNVSFLDLKSVQGVGNTPVVTLPVAAQGDVAGPTLSAGQARLWAPSTLDALLIETNEALEMGTALDTQAYTLNGTVHPDLVDLVGPRSVVATFSGGVAVTDTIDVDLVDLAGNSQVQSVAVTAEDTVGPLVISVSGTSVANLGGDSVAVHFNKPVDESVALVPSNYTIQNGSTQLSMLGVSARYVSGTNTVLLNLPSGTELKTGQSLTVGVSNIGDNSQLTGPTASIGGSVGGDSVAPSIAWSFVNLRVNSSSRVVDVAFDEEVLPATVTSPASWSCSGGQGVTTVQSRGAGVFRLTLNSALGAFDTLAIGSVGDYAGNVSGALNVQPLH